jgi:acetylornithine/N-succinyldiaminopimelate aminotransferase
MTPGTHGSTFGGNPLASAVASAVLDVMLEDGFLEGVVERGRYMREQAEAVVGRYPNVFELARGSGMLLGLKASGNNVDVVTGLRAHGLLTAPAADNIVRLLPPLTISESEIDTAIEAIEAYCAEQTP